MTSETLIRSLRSRNQDFLALLSLGALIAAILTLAGPVFLLGMLFGEFMSQPVVIPLQGLFIIFVGTSIYTLILFSTLKAVKREGYLDRLGMKQKGWFSSSNMKLFLFFSMISFVVFILFNVLVKAPIVTQMILMIIFFLMFFFILIIMSLNMIPTKILLTLGKEEVRPLLKISVFPMVFFLTTVPMVPLVTIFKDGPILDVWAIYIELLYVLVIWSGLYSSWRLNVLLKRTIHEIEDKGASS
jgi:hypothetical protein